MCQGVCEVTGQMSMEHLPGTQFHCRFWGMLKVELDNFVFKNNHKLRRIQNLPKFLYENQEAEDI